MAGHERTPAAADEGSGACPDRVLRTILNRVCETESCNSRATASCSCWAAEACSYHARPVGIAIGSMTSRLCLHFPARAIEQQLGRVLLGIDDCHTFRRFDRSACDDDRWLRRL